MKELWDEIRNMYSWLLVEVWAISVKRRKQVSVYSIALLGIFFYLERKLESWIDKKLKTINFSNRHLKIAIAWWIDWNFQGKKSFIPLFLRNQTFECFFWDEHKLIRIAAPHVAQNSKILKTFFVTSEMDSFQLKITKKNL